MLRTIHLSVLGALCFILFLGSCQTPKDVNYFQDIRPGENVPVVQPKYITFQPGDKATIVVKSKDPELAELFNLSTVSYRVGQGTNNSYYNGSQNVSFYTIDSEGNIDFPVIGKVHIAGLKRDEVGALIKGMLIGKNLVKDAVVTVDFANLSFSVLGEVTRPGQYSIDRDQVTLLDALGKAGDLTIYGQRRQRDRAQAREWEQQGIQGEPLFMERRVSIASLLYTAKRRHLCDTQCHQSTSVYRQRQQCALHLILDLTGIIVHIYCRTAQITKIKDTILYRILCLTTKLNNIKTQKNRQTTWT